MPLQNYPPADPKPAPGTVIARNFVATPVLTASATRNGTALPTTWVLAGSTPEFTTNPVRFPPAWNFMSVPEAVYALRNPSVGVLHTIPLDLAGTAGHPLSTKLAVGCLYRGLGGIELGVRLKGHTGFADTTNFFHTIVTVPDDGQSGDIWRYAVVDVPTLPPPPDNNLIATMVLRDGVQANGKPAGTADDGSVDHVELIWRRPTDSPNHPFEIAAFRCDLATKQYANAWVDVPPLIPNTEYFDAARHHEHAEYAFRWTGPANASASAAEIPVPDVAPAAPTGLTASKLGSTTVTLSWTAPADKDLQTFRIYRDMNTTPIATVAAGTLTYDVTGLTPSTMATFTVTAVDRAGHESQRSDPCPVTTHAAPVVNPPMTGSGSGATGSGSAGSGTHSKVGGSYTGGTHAKQSGTVPAPLTGMEVAEFMAYPPDPDAAAIAAKHLPVMTLLARAYTRGHGFIETADHGWLPNEEIRAVILMSTARTVANPEQLAYAVGGVGMRDGWHGWTLGELGVLHRYRPRSI